MLPFLKAHVVTPCYLLSIFEFIIPRLPAAVKYPICILGNRLNLYLFLYGVLKIAVDFPYIQLAHGAEQHIFFHNIADFHIVADGIALILKGNGSIIRSVQLLADNSGAKRVSVQSDHQVQHGGAVVCLDRSGIFVRT